MQTQAETPRALPPAPDGDRYDYRLLRALLSNLQRDGLSFPVLDANASGQRILSAIAAGLQYVLPFDDSDPSPLRLAGRVHLVVPRRFKTEALNNETPSEDHHGAKPLDSRLSAKKLRSYGEAIAGFIGCAPWSETSRWQPFMSDVSALADGMVKLAAAMDKNAAAKETARKETVPLRAPDREEDVVGSEFKEPCAPHDCSTCTRGCGPSSPMSPSTSWYG